MRLEFYPDSSAFPYENIAPFGSSDAVNRFFIQGTKRKCEPT